MGLFGWLTKLQVEGQKKTAAVVIKYVYSWIIYISFIRYKTSETTYKVFVVLIIYWNIVNAHMLTHVINI